MNFIHRVAGLVMPLRLTSREVFLGCPWGRPRTCYRDYISHLACKCFVILPEELVGVAGERVDCASLVKLLPQQPRLR